MRATAFKMSPHEYGRFPCERPPGQEYQAGGEIIHPEYLSAAADCHDLQREFSWHREDRAAKKEPLFLVIICFLCLMLAIQAVSIERLAGRQLVLPAPATPRIEERFNKITEILAYLLAEPRVSEKPLDGADLPVVAVIAEKAYLRLGPGKGHSPVLAVTKGTRLVVEKQSGNWFRVVAPNGESLWASSEVIDGAAGASVRP